jgi:hypothetical protein
MDRTAFIAFTTLVCDWVSVTGAHPEGRLRAGQERKEAGQEVRNIWTLTPSVNTGCCHANWDLDGASSDLRPQVRIVVGWLVKLSRSIHKQPTILSASYVARSGVFPSLSKKVIAAEGCSRSRPPAVCLEERSANREDCSTNKWEALDPGRERSRLPSLYN